MYDYSVDFLLLEKRIVVKHILTKTVVEIEPSIADDINVLFLTNNWFLNLKTEKEYYILWTNLFSLFNRILLRVIPQKDRDFYSFLFKQTTDIKSILPQNESALHGILDYSLNCLILVKKLERVYICKKFRDSINMHINRKKYIKEIPYLPLIGLKYFEAQEEFKQLTTLL